MSLWSKTTSKSFITRDDITQQPLQAQKKFWSKKFGVKNFFGSNNVGPKKMLVQKHLGSKIILDPKTFLSKKNMDPNNFESKNIFWPIFKPQKILWYRKKLSPKRFQVQKEFGGGWCWVV